MIELFHSMIMIDDNIYDMYDIFTCRTPDINSFHDFIDVHTMEHPKYILKFHCINPS